MDLYLACTYYNVMEAKTPELLTSGDIAKRLGRSVYQVRHVLASRLDIAPCQHAALVRLYRADVVDRVRAELIGVDAWNARLARSRSLRKKAHA